MRPLIIGYGNSLRGDDGLGQAAARELSGRLGDEAEVLAVEQLNPELAEAIASATLVIFIDMAIGDEAGLVIAKPLQPELHRGSSSTHYLSPEELLGLSAKLYGREPEAHLFSITGGEFAAGRGLSRPVVAAMPQLLAGVVSLVRSAS